jgi:hypothetical protein
MKAHWLMILWVLIFCSMRGFSQPVASTLSPDSLVEMRFRIFYPVNQTDIHEDYMGNADMLHRIRKYLEKSPQIDHITIYSYASPEGPYALNKRLAAERGKTAKQYLISQFPAERHLPDSLIVLDPTAENWGGLRDLVYYQCQRDDKDEILAILDRTDITDERRKVLLKRLNQGRPWLYILKELMPQLRYATWISVWQRIQVDRVMEEPINLAMAMPAMSLPKLELKPMVSLAEEEDTKTILALKTNLLYDALSWLNFSVEVPIGDRFSALYYHQFPWWTWGKANNEYCMRFLSIGAEGRWWFKPMPREKTEKRIKRDRLMGHFLGVYAESGKWDFERKRDICYQGEHWSAGLSYGYAMPIGKRLNLELSLSVGYASIAYRGYTPSEDYEILWRDPEKVGRWHYFGPTKAQVSLVLPFIVKVKKGGMR